MTDHQATVFVVDDDEGVRDALSLLVEEERLRVEDYPSARAFLDAYDPARPGCLVLDIRMPESNGLKLQETLTTQRIRIPIIFITGHGNVSLSVQALKAGALDVLEKPFDDNELLDRIHEAIALDAQRRRNEAEKAEFKARFSRLTPREQEVMVLTVADKSCKDIASELNVSHRTVEAHRSRIMQKMEASSLLELAHMAIACGLEGRIVNS